MSKLTPQEVIDQWFSHFDGIMPKQRNDELEAMAWLIENFEKHGVDPILIASKRIEDKVVEACVHQGDLDGKKRKNWTAAVTQSWKIAVNKWKNARENLLTEAPEPSQSVTPKLNLDKEKNSTENTSYTIKHNEEENTGPKSPPKKLEDIKPEERLDQSVFKDVIPEETAENSELLDFFKKN